MRRRAQAHGYALAAALLWVLLVALASAVAVERLVLSGQRERETELLFVGTQYADAIDRYVQATPGPVKVGPLALQDLLLDERGPRPRRHLRRLYPDPITGRDDWELVRVNGRIVGVHSASAGIPLKKSGFPARHSGFAEARTYSEWRFMARAAGQPAAPPAAPPSEPPSVAPPPTPAEPPSDPAPGPPDARRSQCAAEHGARLRECNRLPADSAERRRCVGASIDRYAACLAQRG